MFRDVTKRPKDVVHVRCQIAIVIYGIKGYPKVKTLPIDNREKRTTNPDSRPNFAAASISTEKGVVSIKQIIGLDQGTRNMPKKIAMPPEVKLINT